MPPAFSWLVANATGGGVESIVDLALDDDGDLEIPLRFTTGAEAVAQGLRIRLGMFRGEWFDDLDAGVPWFTEILGQKFVQQRVVTTIGGVARAVPGVNEIVSLSADYDSPTRAVSIALTVRTDFGVVSVSMEVS